MEEEEERKSDARDSNEEPQHADSQEKTQEMDEQTGNNGRNKREAGMTQWKWRHNLKQRDRRSRRGELCRLKADIRNLYFSSAGNLCLLAAGYFVNIQQTVREVNYFASR